MESITESEFLLKVQQENCRANLSERSDAVAPNYLKYKCLAQDFLNKKAFPTWRTNADGSEYIGAFEMSRNLAFPITYRGLSRKPHLFPAIKFDEKQDYLKSVSVISFHCDRCGVYVVKDGNDRLLQCALYNLNPELEIYLVNSRDWSSCRVDMKNFCECISNYGFQGTSALTRRHP